MTEQNDNRKPELSLREGNMSLAVWREHHEDRAYFRYTLQKSYASKEEGKGVEWTHYFGDREIDSAINLLREIKRSRAKAKHGQRLDEFFGA